MSAAVLAQLSNLSLAQMTGQVEVVVEVGVSGVQSQRSDASVLQLLADSHELSPGGGNRLDASLSESVLVVEDAADLGLLNDAVQVAGSVDNKVIEASVAVVSVAGATKIYP